MSSTTLVKIEIENFGRFYNPTKLVFDDRITSVVLGAACGKSTFVSALEYLSEAVLEGNIKNPSLNICRTFMDKPKDFVRIEIVLEISDATHSGAYRYGISVTDVGVISEYLTKEATGRRIFYRYKNDIELYGLSDEEAMCVKVSLCADIPILHLLKGCNNSIPAYFIRFFQRLWIIRAGSLNNRLTPSHLFKSSFFTRRKNIEKCCDFLRLFDPTVVDLIKAPNTSKIIVVHRNTNGYDYPVPLAKESDSFIKLLALFRAIDALAAYGGTVLWDCGDMGYPWPNADSFINMIFEGISIIFFLSNRNSCEPLNSNLSKNVDF